MKTNNLRLQLIVMVCIVTLLPFSIGQWMSYQRINMIVEENLQLQKQTNLNQMDKTLDATLSAYEDLLYQLYTDDTMVSLVKKLTEGREVSVSRNQLRREIQGKAYAKPYVQAITVLFADGSYSCYDKLNGSSTHSSWLEDWNASQLFMQVAQTNTTHYFPAAFAMQVAGESKYLFHVAHRVVDYRNIEKRDAIVIISIDEALLYSLYNANWQDGVSTFFHMLIADGRIISAPHNKFIGQTVEEPIAFARKSGLLDSSGLVSDAIVNKRTGWQLLYVQDQSIIYIQLANQQSLTLWIMISSVVLLIIVIILLIRLLTRSMVTVTQAMKQAEHGDLTVRVSKIMHMPSEIRLIATQFNAMMDEINTLMQAVRVTSMQRHDAEIAMLEAQINPHFLYNTLDTINWMAIDEDAFDISNAITSLAHILRYGIDGSNQTVTVHDEVEWIKQYLNLQQIRLKNTLDFRLCVEPDTLDLLIHKLLFQPFIENAILHGFEGVKRTHVLEIMILLEADQLSITIRDNGKGMDEAQLHALTTENSMPDETKHHLGVRNAMQRIRMYYGECASVLVSSELDRGTSIVITLPMGEKEIA